MTTTTPINNAAPSYVTGGTMYDDATMGAMSAEDILAYVRASLTDIDGQLNDYKDIVAKRQAQAEALREAMGLLREAEQNNGELVNMDPDAYARAMNLLTELSHIPSVASARQALLESYGDYESSIDYTMPEGGPVLKAGKNVTSGLLARDENGKETGKVDQRLKATEFENVMDGLRSGLESLNSDNEMLMMNVQKLMQQRNQSTQWASNMLKVNDEMLMAIIGNYR